MKKPIDIEFPPQTDLITTIPNTMREWSKYNLFEARQLVNQWPTGCICEQWYENPISLIHLIQVEVAKDMSLTFFTNYHELYVFHLLLGEKLTLNQPKNQNPNHDIHLREQEYAMTYLPKDTYEVQLRKGRYVVFYFVIKSSFLLKEPYQEFEQSKLEPLIALRNQVELMTVSGSIPISNTARSKIDQYLRRPGDNYLQKAENLIKITFFLLSTYLIEIRMHLKLLKKKKKLIKLIKSQIYNMIHNGDRITLEKISKNTDRNFKYLNQIFLVNEGISIQKYIIQVKLEEAIQLLDNGLNVEQTAHFLNFTTNYFRDIFQKHYGEPPSKYKKK